MEKGYRSISGPSQVFFPCCRAYSSIPSEISNECLPAFKLAKFALIYSFGGSQIAEGETVIYRTLSPGHAGIPVSVSGKDSRCIY